MREKSRKFELLLASCFGLGLIPAASGTFGSLPPAIIYMIMGYFQPCDFGVRIVMGIIVLLFSAVCILLGDKTAKLLGKEDPGEIVADETAGMALVFAIVGMAEPSKICMASAVCFALFRFFDILKPWPVRNLEKLPGGWGILCDDLAAGIYAGSVFLCLKNIF